MGERKSFKTDILRGLGTITIAILKMEYGDVVYYFFSIWHINIMNFSAF